MAFDQTEHIYTTEDISNNKKRPHSESFSVWYIVFLIVVLAFLMSGGLNSISRFGNPQESGDVPYYGTGKSAP